MSKATVPFDTALEAAIRRDRLIVVVALAAVITLSWAYLLAGAGMALMEPAIWTFGYVIVLFFMWWVMMVAMMLPSAAPIILLFAAVNRKQREAGHNYVATSIFVAGYLAAWGGFSLAAVAMQWAFEQAGFLSPMLFANNAIFGGVLLLAAGIYQLTPVKHSCLRHCRSPLAFLSTHWRRGTLGAVQMGFVHGAFCVGCCWFLMGLLFFGGVMNLYWIAGLALFVLFEKTTPAGHWLCYAAGAALLVWGAGVLAFAL